MTTPASTAAWSAWADAARAAARQPPLRARWPLWLAGRRVGSIVPQVFDALHQNAALGSPDVPMQLSKSEQKGCVIDTPPAHASAALDAVAGALRAQGRHGPWRNEQLAVRDLDSGERVATVERGMVRVLGVPTEAVHLIGLAPDGRMWVQQRAHDKAQNPGMWDTLMGGMVSSADALASALARETWEEAGLHVAHLHALAYGGHADFALPSREGGGVGYMQERIHWYSATVPQGQQPVNQDGEVAQFQALPLATVRQWLQEGAFTPEAALVLAGYFGW